MNFIKYAIADLFDLKIIKYAFAPLLLSLIFWGGMFYFFSDVIVGFIHAYVSLLPFGETINNILTKIGSSVLLVFLYYEMVILSLGVFSSFFVDKIVLRINNKHYNLAQKSSSILEGVWISLKALFYFMLIFIFTFYLFFIPVVNIFYQMFLWSVAVKKPLVFDSTSVFCDYKSFEKKNSLKIWSLVFLTSVIYFIPFISFFGYTFQLVIMTHFALSDCKKTI